MTRIRDQHDLAEVLGKHWSALPKNCVVRDMGNRVSFCTELGWLQVMMVTVVRANDTRSYVYVRNPVLPLLDQILWAIRQSNPVWPVDLVAIELKSGINDRIDEAHVVMQQLLDDMLARTPRWTADLAIEPVEGVDLAALWPGLPGLVGV